MIRPKYKEVLLSLLLSLVARNSLAGDILSSPRQLHVRTERSRAAVLVSRSVSSASTAPSATDVQSETGNETTTAAALPASQAHKETGTFELVFAGIHELDNNSVPVGGASHSFYKFNDVSMAFLSAVSMSAKKNENQLPHSTGGASGVCQNSHAALHEADTGSDSPNATVIANMCAVESSGTSIRDGEKMAVSEGQFQMSVDVDGWQWCGCDQREGKFVEFNVTIVVPTGYKINVTQGRSNSSLNVPVKISLGTNDSYVMISTKYGTTVGSSTTWKTMTASYPMLTMADGDVTRANLTVRVPRETDGRLTVATLVVEPGYISSEHVSGPTSACPCYIGTPVALLVATVAFVAMAIMFGQR